MRNRVHAVGVMFEDERGRVLVLCRHPKSHEGGKWGLPGGSLEPGERPMAAAAREVFEEIRHLVSPKNLEPLRKYTWHWDDKDVTFEVFKVQVIGSNLHIELNLSESTAFMWESVDRLVQRGDLMKGLYPILRDEYDVSQ